VQKLEGRLDDLFLQRALPGSPSGYPNGRSTTSARGGLTRAVTSRSSVIETVGIPDFSITLWTSPTDWWHIGQTGVSNTASTWSSARLLAISGAVTCISRPGAVIEPMKL